MPDDDMALVDPAWLRQLGAQGLADLILRRPEAAYPPPHSLADLAVQLCAPVPIMAALQRLELPALQVSEALAALGGVADRPALQRLLGVPGRHSAAEVDQAVGSLQELALVRLDEAERLCLIQPIRTLWTQPLGLGPTIATLAERSSIADLKQICAVLGVTAPAGKAEVIAAVVATLADSEAVRSVVAKAPHDVRELLTKLAATGEELFNPYTFYSRERAPKTSPLLWAARRGLLMPALNWSGNLVMPAEVALALRGPDYAAPFDPRPPRCARTDADASAVERDAAAAAGSFVRLVTAVLGLAGQGQVATVRDGGVGVREIKRLAKRYAATPEQVKLAIELAHKGKLFSTAMLDGAAPTDRCDAWHERSPAHRLAQLIRVWERLPSTPLLAPNEAWQQASVPDGNPHLRLAMLRTAAAAPGTAIADVDALAEVIRWSQPLVAAHCAGHLRRYVRASWQEAALLGLLGTHALSQAGHALLAGDGEALVDALSAVGETVDRAHLQADLTAVVAGTPSQSLSELLDAAADRESTAAASTWRFSQASIRRALDAGHGAEALRARLSEAGAGALPQTLDYLIGDVARRHGAVRACAAQTVLRSEDTALLAEIAADRKLHSLSPRLLAPTVLACAGELPAVLATLRSAGYAPVAEDALGNPLLAKPTRRRAQVAASRREATDSLTSQPPTVADSVQAARELVEGLLARPDGDMNGRAATVRQAFDIIRLLDDGDDLDIDFED